MLLLLLLIIIFSMKNKLQPIQPTSYQYKELLNLSPSVTDSFNSKDLSSFENTQQTVSGSYVFNSGRKLKKRSTLKAEKLIKDHQETIKQGKLLNIEKQSSLTKESSRKNYSIINLNTKTQQIEGDLNFKNKFKAYRVNRLVKHFVDKLKRVSIYRQPIVYQPFNLEANDRYFLKGINLHKYIFYAFLLFSIVTTFANSLLSTFIIAFPFCLPRQQIYVFDVFSLIWILFQIMFGFIICKEKGPNKLIRIRDIAEYYLKTQFIFDVLFFLAVVLRFVPNIGYQYVFEFLVFFKIQDAIKKLKILEIKIMQFSYQQQFWGLFKMFLTNFFLFHFIAISMLLMSKLQPDRNWILVKNLQDAEWWEQYGWAFYWAATTMLTVGFGDIVPANLKQALALVVIEVFSCMTLAYNINLMGKVLDQIQKHNIEKHKNLKILRQVCDEHEIESDLQFKLLNHIKQSHKIETKFNFEEKSKFVQQLPNNIKTDYLRESNSKILNRIQFIKNFSHKSVYKIAEKLNEKMAHPWEIVIDHVSDDLVILREGRVGLFPNFRTKKNQQIAVNYFQSLKKQNQSLISMNFARRQYSIQNYQLKSVGYSLIKWLDKKEFMEILRQRPQDIQFFCSFTDKERKDNEEDFQLIKCQQCQRYHTKFTCPRLHFSPIYQKTIFRYLNDFKKSRTDRKQNFKRKKIELNSLVLFKTAFDNPTFQNFRTSQLQFCDNIYVKNHTFGLKKNEQQKQIDWSDPGLKLFKESLKHEFFGIVDLRKSVDPHFWIMESDKAQDYQFYFPNSNPKDLDKFNTKKLQLRKATSINRTKTLARKSCS